MSTIEKPERPYERLLQPKDETNLANEELNSEKSLWDCAYDALKKENPELVVKYETLLSIELLKKDPEPHELLLGRACRTLDKRDHSSNNSERRSQWNSIIECGLHRIDEGQINLPSRTRQIKESVLWANTFIGEGVKTYPQASMAWASICAAIPILKNPIIAKQEIYDGCTYVTTRMYYYAALEPLLREIRHDPASVAMSKELNDELELRIINLYKHILDFQFRIILGFYPKWYNNYGRMFIPTSDNEWAEMKKNIVALEQRLHACFVRSDSVSTKARLKNLRTKAGELYYAFLMQQLLPASKIPFDHGQCHQLFRLTKDNKDEGYEWYKNCVNGRALGTCVWFIKHERFRSWWVKETSKPVLVLSAGPGTGKSVLIKHLIDNVLPSTATVCYFFFKDQDQNTLKQALCAFLHQLFTYKPFLIRYAIQSYHEREKLTGDTTLLWNILEVAVADPETGPVTFVLDALNECIESDVKELIRLLKWHNEYRSSLSKVKFLLTSRPYDRIIADFPGWAETSACVHISGDAETDAITQEVDYVILHRVSQLGREKDLSWETMYRLEKRLLEIPHRTHLWVDLVFDYMLFNDAFQRGNEDIESAIATLPQSVDEAYEKILGMSPNQDQETTRKALSILLAASRPLTFAEMNIAVKIDASEIEENFQTTLGNCKWCRPLISTYHGKVYLSHQTAREFLLSSSSQSGLQTKPFNWQGSISPHEAQSVIAESCIAYLALINTDENGATSKRMFTRHDNFLEYSAMNWASHFRSALISNDEPLVSLVFNICDPNLKSAPVWFKTFWKRTSGYSCPDFTAVFMAAYFGLAGIMKLLLEKGADTESKDNVFRKTPFLWAAQNGHDTIVKLLLENGADIDAPDDMHQTKLGLAAMLGEMTTARLLLENGADVEWEDAWGHRPLMYAVKHGHRDLVELLLDNGADIEWKDKWGRTVLSYAVDLSHEDIVELLLEQGADTEVIDKNHQTQLAYAGRERIVNLLLEKTLEKTGVTGVHSA